MWGSKSGISELSMQKRQQNHPRETHSARKILQLFYLRFYLIQNRRSPPECTHFTEQPAHSVFYSILLFIVRNICPIVKGKRRPAQHFVQKNKPDPLRLLTPFASSFPEGSCFHRAVRTERARLFVCYSRYIRRSRIRRAGVRPYSRARYSSALPHCSRMVCRMKGAAAGSTPAMPR